MVVVTGANGFIGSALVWALNEEAQRQDLLCTDLVSPKRRPALLKKRRFEKFLDHQQLLSELPNLKNSVEWVIHMGACSSTTEMNREYLREINTEYTQTLFNWCAQNSIPFIFASSGAVYGDGANGFDDRVDPNELEPLNPYGESKVAVDRWVQKQTEVPPHWYGLRFFNVFGPHEYFKGDMASVVYKAFLQIGENSCLRLFRSHNPDYLDGEQKRDFVYVKDICRWILELIEKKPDSGLYNMGYGQARTWLELAEATFQGMNKPKKIEWVDIPESIRDRYQYFTCARMDRWFELGLSHPQWSLEQGIEDYLQNYLLTKDPYL